MRKLLQREVNTVVRAVTDIQVDRRYNTSTTCGRIHTLFAIKLLHQNSCPIVNLSLVASSGLRLLSVVLRCHRWPE